MSVAAVWDDPDDVRRSTEGDPLLAAFNDALVLTAGDIHIARRIGRLTGEGDPTVVLAAALAARAPRLGHVCVDLALAASTVHPDTDTRVDVDALPWPPLDAWLAAVAASPAVAPGDGVPATAPGGDGPAPLRLAGTLLYLDRYWRQEITVAADLTERNRAAACDPAVVRSALDRLFPPPPADGPPGGGAGPDRQRLAAAVAAGRHLAVIAGGPGTGKTTTVARLLALLDAQARAAGAPPPKVALAAPTGKAAARLQEAVAGEAAALPVDDATRARLLALRASTLHRLLGWRPGSTSRFRHDRTNRLPFDVVVVDETSMVSLAHMAKLLEAVRPDARLVLVGDADQLSSVEAGAVLGDVVGPAATSLRMGPAARAALGDLTGETVPDDAADAGRPGAAGIGDGIVVLTRGHRFGGGISRLAAAVQRGDAGATLAALRAGTDDVTWLAPSDTAALRATVTDAAVAVVTAARLGDGAGALSALASVRVLCAHRSGPAGVATWVETVEGWLAEAVPDYAAAGRWYPGRPLLVTRNDYSLGLYNGDVGVVVATASGRPAAAFERGGAIAMVPPTRLEAVETVHAMTVHKAQGSQFATVVVVLPDPESRLATRELLYTAVTRARSRVLVVGDEAAVRAAVERPVARASGLRARLWDEPPAGRP